MVSEKEYIVIEMYESVFDKIKRAFRRGIGIIYNPFVTFTDIAEDPDVLGPFLIVLLYLFSSLISRELYYNKVIVNIVDPKSNAVIESISMTFQDINQVLVFLGSVGLRVIVGWILITLALWILGGLLGGDVRGKAIFASVGYLLMLSILELILRDINFIIASYGFNIIEVNISLKEDRRNILPIVSNEINRQLSSVSWPYMQVDKFLWILFRTWLLGSFIALSNSVSKLSLKKSVVTGAICFLIVLFTGLFT